MTTRTQQRSTEAKEAFLEAYAEAGTITAACRHALVCRQTVHRWINEDPAFAARFDEARESKIEVLEQSLYQKALGGDTVASIFLLKAARPTVYSDRARSEALLARQASEAVTNDFRVAGRSRDEARRQLIQDTLGQFAKLGLVLRQDDGGITVLDAASGEVIRSS